MSQDKLLTIFAHQDDETFSAGGILAKYANIGKSVSITVTADPNRKDEFIDACSILECEPIILDNQNVSARNEREIFNQLKLKLREISPSHVITHIENDYHHEHRRVRKIVEEAVEWVSHTTSEKTAVQIRSLWAAETTVLIPTPQIFIDISDYNQQRLNAIKCYESQTHKGGEGFYSRFHDTRTKLRGIQAGVEHAEAFVQIPINLVGSFKPNKVLNKFPY